MKRRYLFLPVWRFPQAGTARTPDQEAARLHKWHRYRRLLMMGYRRGWRTGCAEGKTAGEKRGLQEGQRHGWNHGLAQGLEEGRRQGMTVGDKDCQRLVELLESLWQQLAGHHNDYWKQLHRDLATLVDAVCRQVVFHELTTSAEVLDQLVHKAMEQLPREESMQVFVHPDDASLMAQVSARLPGAWNICADGELNMGDCVLKAGSGTADARMETRLALCIQSLQHILEGGNGSC